MKFKIILLIAIFLLSCKKNINDDKKDVNIDSELVSVYDSISFEYPDSLFPKKIADIAFIGNSIYVLNSDRNAKYPIVKFTKDGKYIKTIGKIGNGPFEMSFTPQQICSSEKYLAIFSMSSFTIWLVKDDKIIKKVSMREENSQITGITFIDSVNILLSAYGRSERHIYILDENLKVKKRLFDLPDGSELATYAGYHIINGLFKRNNEYYTHIGYPPYFYKITTTDGDLDRKSINDEKRFKNFKRVNVKEIKEKYDKRGISPRDLLTSFSMLYFLYEEGGCLFGMYFSPDAKKGNSSIYLFLLKDGENLIEKKINSKEADKLFIYDSGLAKTKFYYDKDILKVKIYFLRLTKRM